MTSNSDKKSSSYVCVPRSVLLVLVALAFIGLISLTRLVLDISGVLIKIALLAAVVAVPAGLAFFAVMLRLRALRESE